jgi:hypothetical protein
LLLRRVLKHSKIRLFDYSIISLLGSVLLLLREFQRE